METKCTVTFTIETRNLVCNQINGQR